MDDDVAGGGLSLVRPGLVSRRLGLLRLRTGCTGEVGETERWIEGGREGEREVRGPAVSLCTVVDSRRHVLLLWYYSIAIRVIWSIVAQRALSRGRTRVELESISLKRSCLDMSIESHRTKRLSPAGHRKELS